MEFEATGARGNPQRARLGHGRDGQRLRIIGAVDRRSRERLEPDEHVREPRAVQESPEFERQFVGRWQRVIQRSDDGRGLGSLGEARHRPEREQAAGQPQDEQCLDAGNQPAAESVNAAEDALPEPRSEPYPDRRADRLPDDDRAEQPDQHEERTHRRLDIGERLLQELHGADGQAAADERAHQAADLRQGPGAQAEQDRDHDEHDRERVEQVHRRIVA